MVQDSFKLTAGELSFLKAHELGRLATSSIAAVPHVVPVIYALDAGSPIIAIDYGTKKLKNIKENPRGAFLVDDYRPNRAIMLTGECVLHEQGQEYMRLLKVLFRKFEYYRKHPWKEGEAPILKLVPKQKVSWGIRS